MKIPLILRFLFKLVWKACQEIFNAEFFEDLKVSIVSAEIEIWHHRHALVYLVLGAYLSEFEL
jgi:hypothetical protein